MKTSAEDAAEQYAARLEDALVRDADCCVVKGLGSNPGESRDVCKSIVPLRHGDTLNSHRAAGPLVRLVEGEERWEVADHLRMFSLKIPGNKAKLYCHLHDAQSYS
ncbi:hypothetical protein TNCV_22251 [Trichonephila clavipes]|nr:hypothetical protein TNCV_22251 [Trichonephila clavipes]